MSDAIEIIIIVILILAIVGVMCFMFTKVFDEIPEDKQIDLMNFNEVVNPYQVNEVINPCQHEFVTKSRYNIFLKAYKIYSECIKCGYEV